MCIIALVLVPTHELCMQVYELLQKLLHRYYWIVPGYIMGGESRSKEKSRLRKGRKSRVNCIHKLCLWELTLDVLIFILAKSYFVEKNIHIEGPVNLFKLKSWLRLIGSFHVRSIAYENNNMNDIVIFLSLLTDFFPWPLKIYFRS